VVWRQKRLLVAAATGAVGWVAAAGGLGVAEVTVWSDSLAVDVVAAVLGIAVLAVVGAVVNAALVCAADDALRGRRVRIGAGYARAAGRWAALLGWGLLGTMARVVGRVIGELTGDLGEELFGMVWGFAGFLVVPGLVLDDLTLREAMRTSVRGLRTRGGAEARAGWILALPTVGALLPALALLILGGESADQGFTVAVLAAAGLLLALGVALTVALWGVFRVLLYRDVRRSAVAVG
jgi:hypothetical protein